MLGCPILLYLDCLLNIYCQNESALATATKLSYQSETLFYIVLYPLIYLLSYTKHCLASISLRILSEDQVVPARPEFLMLRLKLILLLQLRPKGKLDLSF